MCVSARIFPKPLDLRSWNFICVIYSSHRRFLRKKISENRKKNFHDFFFQNFFQFFSDFFFFFFFSIFFFEYFFRIFFRIYVKIVYILWENYDSLSIFVRIRHWKDKTTFIKAKIIHQAKISFTLIIKMKSFQILFLAFFAICFTNAKDLRASNRVEILGLQTAYCDYCDMVFTGTYSIKVLDFT